MKIFNMKSLQHILFFTLMLCTNSHAFSLFGYSNFEECYSENVSKVRFADAKRLLGNACVLGYSDDDSYKIFKSSGKCIVSEVKRLYSLDESLKVINECSKDNETFNMYKKSLYFQRDLDEEANRRKAERAERIRQNNVYESEERIRRELLIQQTSPTRIYDSNSNSYKNCYQLGNTLRCN